MASKDEKNKPLVRPKMVTGSVAVQRLGMNQGLVSRNYPGADMTPSLFRRLIVNRGYDVIWEKAMMCPNRVAKGLNEDEHDLTCDICTQGHVYIDPKRTRMLIQGASLEQQFYIQGRFDGGRSVISAQPEDMITFWDRITLRNSVLRFSETIKRHETENFDSFKYNPLRILAVMDKKKRMFNPETDYRFVGGKLVWTDNEQVRPTPGEFVSVLYDRRPVYIILDMIKQHRDATDNVEEVHRQMPIQATGVLDYLVRDEAADPPVFKHMDNPFGTSGN